MNVRRTRRWAARWSGSTSGSAHDPDAPNRRTPLRSRQLNTPDCRSKYSVLAEDGAGPRSYVADRAPPDRAAMNADSIRSFTSSQTSVMQDLRSIEGVIHEGVGSVKSRVERRCRCVDWLGRSGGNKNTAMTREQYESCQTPRLLSSTEHAEKRPRGGHDGDSGAVAAVRP
jgi:hypothetical protein